MDSDSDLKEIYSQRAWDYERLVVREDYQQNIFAALHHIRALQGLDVVELGAGTGRLTCMMAPVVKSITAFDISENMLQVAESKLERSRYHNWRLGVADHRSLPVPDQAADLAISGWSLVYAAIWAEGDWREELGKALAEMNRILRPGGSIILLETMGTGFETPHPPSDLKDYFNYLREAGFQSTWIRTDYQFESLEEARELAGFFFGQEMTAKILPRERPILPECTGLWWLHT